MSDPEVDGPPGIGTLQPTEEQRRTVRMMSGYGIPQSQIATYLGIDAKTLRKHFRSELDRGAVEATSKVAQSLFRMATEGGSVAAAIFWMKARAGWREKQDLAEGECPQGLVITFVEPGTVLPNKHVIDGDKSVF